MSHAPKSFEDLLRNNTHIPGRKLAIAIGTMLCIFLVWAGFAQINEVAVAEGDVIPQGQVKVIQHLEGGIILDLMVKQGSVVKTGDPLLQLELAVSAVNREELQIRFDGQKLSNARLLAESTGEDLLFPKALETKYPMLAAAERDTYNARRKELTSTLSVLEQQQRQRQEELRELEAKQRSMTTNLSLAERKLTMSRELLKDGLTSKMDHLQMESEVESLRGELAILKHTMPRAKASLQEAENRIQETQNSFSRQSSEQLSSGKISLARTAELLNSADNQQLRTEIRSPIDGIVKNLRYVTIGGVVKPGEAIMDIVPTHQKLQIDVKLNPTDRGYVQVGQDALVKITTYDYARYGGLKGKVVSVAPDTSIGHDQRPYFQVIVETDQTWMGDTPSEFPITTGMEATVDIHTGTRSVLDYLIRPVLKLKHEAFRER